MLWFIIVILLVVADQVTKALIMHHDVLMSGGRVTIIDRFFHLIYTMNRGAAWSFLADQNWGIYILTAVSILVAVALTIVLWKHRHGFKPWAFTLALMLGGTVGNLIDRIRFGGVVDFLDFQFGDWHFPTFNVADSCLTIGAALLFILILRHGDVIEKQFHSKRQDEVKDTAEGDTP